MKTLYESLLDDEEDIIGDEALADDVIEQWCIKHLDGFKRLGGYVKDGKVNIKYVSPGNYIRFKLGEEGVIPDYIKWGNTKGATFKGFQDCIIKSFKNFPTEFNIMGFYDMTEKGLPNDFTSWGEKIQGNELTISIDNIKSLKGLKGYIKKLYITADELISFDCPNLKVDELHCIWTFDYNLKSFDNLPKITDVFDIECYSDAFAKAQRTNIKKPNKITWDYMRAPGYFYDILNKK